MSPDKVLCFHLENIRCSKTSLRSSFSIEKVWIWTSTRQLSSHALEGKTLIPGMSSVSKLIIQKHTAFPKQFFKGNNHCKSGTYSPFHARHALHALPNLQKGE